MLNLYVSTVELPRDVRAPLAVGLAVCCLMFLGAEVVLLDLDVGGELLVAVRVVGAPGTDGNFRQVSGMGSNVVTVTKFL